MFRMLVQKHSCGYVRAFNHLRQHVSAPSMTATSTHVRDLQICPIVRLTIIIACWFGCSHLTTCITTIYHWLRDQ